MLGKRSTDELARPMQTLIWYPAEKSGNSPIVFGDYLALSVKELEPTADKGSVEFLALLKKRYGDLVNEKTWAVQDGLWSPALPLSEASDHLPGGSRLLTQASARRLHHDDAAVVINKVVVVVPRRSKRCETPPAERRDNNRNQAASLQSLASRPANCDPLLCRVNWAFRQRAQEVCDSVHKLIADLAEFRRFHFQWSVTHNVV